jgi:signal transduction histidine kinase
MSIRRLRRLDARGRLGEPPRPLQFAAVTFALSLALGVSAFVLGRSDSGNAIFSIVAIGMFGLSLAIGSALAVTQYRAFQDLDAARAELLAEQHAAELRAGEAADRRHDARAITAAMGAALHALERDPADARIIGAMSDQLDGLRGLLTPTTPTLQPVSLATLIAPIHSFATLHGMALDLELDPSVSVLADRRYLPQVLQNLVDNARKYASDSTVRVHSEPAGPYIRIVVEDEGHGIEGDPEEAFIPGVRGTEGSQGYGMGLAIARRMVEEMHGALWYEHGHSGAAFVIKLLKSDGAGEAEA